MLKPVLLFLQRLLTQRTLALSDGDVSALAQQVVGRFQQWPRTAVGGMMTALLHRRMSRRLKLHECMTSIIAASAENLLLALVPTCANRTGA